LLENFPQGRWEERNPKFGDNIDRIMVESSAHEFNIATIQQFLLVSVTSSLRSKLIELEIKRGGKNC